MAGIVADSAKSAKSLAQQVARQMAREPLEVLKEAGQQVAGTEERPSQETAAPKEAGFLPEEKARIESQGARALAALEEELKDIRIEKGRKELIQKEEERAQVVAQENQKNEALPGIPAKPSRRFPGFGQKAQAEKQKTRIEKPLPPSG
ncbi:hypothetical protein A2V61_02920 [Candidatus Woesebacteria bacterium RBG_19FT_COMBO_47_8]|uniref:Uncharacterized protein n=1 Tax=Candidatus Woesebacteria bacterium RBG_13_46_13 TaxID=1802479 RepID=A0A1F7X4I5_9BACT|nr:MAG: hypothetical protein A2Y68_00940 [Candidatus Woesebacteria bacterium RBG_13_46_13]OGM18127.1 MAG: hypothetical protein A2V61_02920 [Candidatus Woesebacteria bacterium RBG_19FT_COMBO_47_8]HJX59479.1 hypothetical protein [Patescibacteria group bacterium]